MNNTEKGCEHTDKPFDCSYDGCSNFRHLKNTEKECCEKCVDIVDGGKTSACIFCPCHKDTEGVEGWESRFAFVERLDRHYIIEEVKSLLHAHETSLREQAEKQRCDKCGNSFEHNHWRHYSPRTNKVFHTGCFEQYKFPAVLEERENALREQIREEIEGLYQRCPEHATEHYLNPDGRCKTCEKYQRTNIAIEAAANIASKRV